MTILSSSLIDDMVAGTPSILMQGGRVGSWYTYNDGTAGAVQAPVAGSACDPAVIPGGYCGSAHAQHTTGSGFTTWGAGLGFDLNNTGTARQPYDASGFTGIAFQAQGSPAVRFIVTESATVPVAQGGTCASKCSDSHGTAVDLGSGWAQYAIPFSSLTQQGWGTPATFDPGTVLSVQFQVAASQSFDVWITDIGFY